MTVPTPAVAVTGGSHGEHSSGPASARADETGDLPAILASDALAQDLDRRGSSWSDMRTEALVALNALIWQLGSAEPTEQTKELGLGW